MLSWFTNPTVREVILFGISIAVSLWAKEIRTSLGSAVRGAKSSTLQELERELRFIEWINGNTYNLMLWALRNSLRTIVNLFVVVFVGYFIINIVLNDLFHKAVEFKALYPLFGSTFLGLVGGRAINMYTTILHLYSYEEYVVKLNAKLTKLKAELEVDSPAVPKGTDDILGS